MTTYTLTLPLTKNDNNSYIDANSVTIGVSNKNIKNITEAIKSMTEAANNTRISLAGTIDWLQDGKETDDRIDYEELIVFKDGDLYVVGTEKYSSIEVESNSFRIDEVDDILNGFTKEDEEIQNLAEENKNMAYVLESFGFNNEEISNICYGSYKPTVESIKATVVVNKKATKKDINEATFTKCPRCSCEDISWDVKGVDFEGDFVFRTHECSNCQLKFDETYSLSVVEVEEEFEEHTDGYGRAGMLADELYSKSSVIFDTPRFTIHATSLSSGFNVDVYPLGTKHHGHYEFECESVDSGIIQDGDALDTIAYAFEF